MPAGRMRPGLLAAAAFLAWQHHATAATIEVALHNALGKTVVVAYDSSKREFVAQSASDPSPDHTAVHAIDNLWNCAGGASDGPSLFVFGGDNAATYLDARQICNQLATSPRVTFELAPAPTIELFIWPRDRQLLPAIHDELANTNWLYRHSLVGVRFNARIFTPGIGLDFTVKNNKSTRSDTYEVERKGVRVTLDRDAQDPNCDALRATTKLLETPGINVFAGFASNWTCAANKLHQRDIVFINDVEALGAMAHELGHASGLDSATDGNPDLRYDRGHVPPLAAHGRTPPADPKTLFGAGNSMWPQSMILHDALTLGQLFWMNFSDGSFLGQTRARLPGAPPSFHCPEPDSCPGYSLDFDATAPAAARQEDAAAPLSNPACGAARDTGCPRAAFSLGSASRRVGAGLKAMTHIGQTDAVFNLHFELTAHLSRGLAENHPHYCTQEELIRTLKKRFTEACVSRSSGSAKCGHRDRAAFVNYWKKNVTAAGLLEVTAAAMQAARDVYTPGAGESDAVYAGATYREARQLISEQPLRLKKAQGKRVLWLDDPGANRIEQDLLASLGMKLGCSQTPADAVRQILGARKLRSLFFGDGPYKLVISRLNAGDLVQEMSAHKIRVPVILYSGDPRVGAEARNVPATLGLATDPAMLVELVIRSLTNQHR